MRAFLTLSLLVFSLVPSAMWSADLSPNDVIGTWRTLLTTDGPKTIGEVIFTLRMDSGGIKGGVLLGEFPGYATITKGRIEGDKIFLSAITGPKVIGGRNVDDFRIEFTGTLRHGVLNVTALDNKNLWGANGINVEGRRLP